MKGCVGEEKRGVNSGMGKVQGREGWGGARVRDENEASQKGDKA